MSVADAPSTQTVSAHERTSPDQHELQSKREQLREIQSVIETVQVHLAPVWPLQDYVAVNPYAGLADQSFLVARESLQRVSDLETLMSVNYYREEFAAGRLAKADIDIAVDELVADGVSGAENIDVNQVLALLRDKSGPRPTADMKFSKPDNQDRVLYTFAEMADRQLGTDWHSRILGEITKHCAAHYDEGQASWASPAKDQPLYQAWRTVARLDRYFEMLGVKGFRQFVAQLPNDVYAAIELLLNQLSVPRHLWKDLCLCEALTMPGWSAWVRYQQRQADQRGEENVDFAGLLAIRLAHEVALSRHLAVQFEWSSLDDQAAQSDGSLPEDNQAESSEAFHEALLRYALLKASEVAYRNRLLGELKRCRVTAASPQEHRRKLAQLVFCIDVRSERIRRRLETVTEKVETFGFAGFFALPIEFVRLAESAGSPQVPVLIAPQFTVHETIAASDASTRQASERRSILRSIRKAWKQFQTTAVSSFSFVETAGLLYGGKLIGRLLGRNGVASSGGEGVRKTERSQLGPSLEGLVQQGITLSKQTDMAESVLRGIGIVKEFGRLVVFCGHGSQTENNPLHAGLECGACGGHSGEPNARFAAKLLNQQHIRTSLAARGIHVPDDTRFVGALHNTVTDELSFFDVDDLPASHREDLEELQTVASQASQQTRSERLPLLHGKDDRDLFRRAEDWSEVRPEWGLAGNAAFIAAPREFTDKISLAGRSFLHSYDFRQDPGYAVLEQIMTAPMVVANWINMQYYASTVDPVHFGSGNKTIHNVVGRFGILSGNGGDLMTGLPWQSIHDGHEFQHHPLRLLVMIAAPRDAIAAILQKHESVSHLVSHGWLQLVAVEGDSFFRRTERQSWDELQATATAQLDR